MPSRFDAEPLMHIVWEDAQELHANAWNPNVVFRPEVKLLEHSILTNGWIQPILINTGRTIIDGFHRWSLAKDSAALKARYKGMVPCVVLDLSEADAMLMTVRINRAKGQHAAVRMSDLVQDLVEQKGLAPSQVAQGIGASVDEVQLLLTRDVFKSKNLADVPYSQAWTVADNGRKNPR